MTHVLLLASLLIGSAAFAKIEKAEPLRLQPRSPASATPSAAKSVPAPTGGRMNAKVIPFKQKSLGAKGYLTNTQIGGCCVLMNTRVRIETLDGKAIHDGPITTIETFTLEGLKPETLYNVFFIHPRFPNGVRLDKVKSGNWVSFSTP